MRKEGAIVVDDIVPARIDAAESAKAATHTKDFKTRVSFAVFNEVMRYVIMSDLLIVCFILLLGVDNSYHNLLIKVHGFLLIISGAISGLKGWIVDRSVRNTIHHIGTNAFFYYATGFGVNRFMFNMFNYLSMRTFKRFVDDGYFTKEQWMKVYAYYSCTQGLTIIYSVLFARNSMGLIDIVSNIALLDNFITCRAHDLGGSIIGVKQSLIPLKWLEDKFLYDILSVLDAVSLWAIILFANYNALTNQSPYEFVTTFSNYKCLVAIIIIDFGIKPLFKNFKRPYVYKYAKPQSFPSGHTALAILAAAQIFNPLFKFIFIFSVGFYRISSRAHTFDDVAAGVVFGSIMDMMWNVFGG